MGGVTQWPSLIAMTARLSATFRLRGRAKEAERALEMACLARFGTLRPQGAVPVVRSNNRLISRISVSGPPVPSISCLKNVLRTPEQNGMIERWFRSVKEECVWQHQFTDFAAAQWAIRRWISWYNEEGSHQALGYRSPRQVAPPAQVRPSQLAA